MIRTLFQCLGRNKFLSAVLLIFTVLAAYSALVDMREKPKAPVDFSKPLRTEEGSIICPQRLLYDPSTDRGQEAVTRLFYTFTDRAEKARALGCEEWSVPVHVHAERMATPFNEYASLSGLPGQAERLFTPVAYLENFPADGQSTLSPAQDLERLRSTVRAHLNTLYKPGPNMRWFTEGSPALESVYLMTPFGPCVDGTIREGKVVMLQTPFEPDSRPTLLGSFDSRGSAAQVAEASCRNQVRAWTSQFAARGTPNDLWFPVEHEPESGSAAQDGATSQDKDQVEPALQGSTDEQAPIVRADTWTWVTRADGSEHLTQAERDCATLRTLSDGRVEVHYLPDGQTLIYTGSDEPVAKEQALQYCQQTQEATCRESPGDKPAVPSAEVNERAEEPTSESPCTRQLRLTSGSRSSGSE